MRKANIEYYIVSDIHGSVRMVIKSTTGEIRQQINYDSFGNIRKDSNPGYTPFGFAGGLYDPRTDLVRFGARDYHRKAADGQVKIQSGFSVVILTFMFMPVMTRSILLTRTGYHEPAPDGKSATRLTP